MEHKFLVILTIAGWIFAVPSSLMLILRVIQFFNYVGSADFQVNEIMGSHPKFHVPGWFIKAAVGWAMVYLGQ